MTLPTAVRRDSAIKKHSDAKKNRFLATAILLLLHLILWIALVTLVISFLLATKADSDLVPSAALLIAAAVGSLAYVVAHTIFYRRVNFGSTATNDDDSDDDSIDYEYDDRMKKIVARGAPAYISVRLVGLSALLWVCAAGWGLVIATRRPICLKLRETIDGVGSIKPSWQAGLPCYLQRAGTGLGIIILLFTLALFVCMNMAEKPFNSHLFGKIVTETQDTGSESINIYFEENSTTRPASIAKSTKPKSLPPLPQESETNSINDDTKSTKSFQRTPYASRPSLDHKKSMEMDSRSIMSRSASKTSLNYSKSVASLNHSRSMPSLNTYSTVVEKGPEASGTVTPVTPSRYHRQSHQRSVSTPYVYPARTPVYRQIDYSQLQRPRQHPVASMGIMHAPSTWKAIHPPTTQFKYASGYPRVPTRASTAAGFSQIRSMPTSQNPYFASTVGRPHTAGSVSSHQSYDTGQYPASWAHYPVVPPGHFLSGKPIPMATPQRQTSTRSSNSSRYGVGSRSTQLSSHAESDEDAITTITTPPSESVPYLPSIKESRVQNPVFPIRAGHLRSNSADSLQYPSRHGLGSQRP